MRVAVALTAGLALWTIGCGGSKGSSTTASSGGTTTGAAPTTGGSSTGGASSGATGGTTGSGTSGGVGTTGGLVAGMTCSADADCLSDICGLNGTGKCCRGPKPCVVSDAGNTTCDSTGCDSNGACLYPDAGTACGAESCVVLTLDPAPRCNAAGACVAVQGTPCAGSYTCDDAGSCNTSCNSSNDCAGGAPCNAGLCSGMPLATGSCTENDDCVSQDCGGLPVPDAGTDGGTVAKGDCCLMPCPSPNPVCAITGCDPGTGACIYPTGMQCAAPNCQGNMNLTSACNDHGDCFPTLNKCPNDLGCNGAHSGCNTSCASPTDCAPGFKCDVDAGTCGP